MGYNKYKNKKVNYFGLKFDSVKEANRYQELLIQQKAGLISELQRQVKFEIIPKNADERAAYYIADFVYKRLDGKIYCEDVKSPISRKLHDYILKRKLMKYRYPEYIFIET